MHARRAVTGPRDDHTHPQVPPLKPLGRPSLPRRTIAPPVGGRGVDWVFNGGHLEWGGGGSPARRRRRGACIARQSTAPCRAVPCDACHTCVVRQGLVGSAPLSSYACSRPRGTVPGRPHPLSGAAVKTSPGAAGPPRGKPAPRLRCPPLKPPGCRWTAAGETGTPPQVPPLNPRAPLHRRGGNRHPASGARRYPPGVQTRTEDRDHGRRARTPGGTAPRMSPQAAQNQPSNTRSGCV